MLSEIMKTQSPITATHCKSHTHLQTQERDQEQKQEQEQQPFTTIYGEEASHLHSEL